jgi:nucleotide-binding universal stress UspA family protein
MPAFDLIEWQDFITSWNHRSSRPMKTILGLIGGGDRDEVIFRTALAAAVPLSAHLDFLHVHVSAGIAAQYDDHVQFAMGAGILSALNHLETKAKTFSEVAPDHVREFCAASKIEICDTPINRKNLTASYREEKDTTKERLIFHARQSDFVVLGRAKQTQGLSPDTLEHLVRNCGRPVILAATAAPQTLTGTIMVCWKKSDNVARVVAAAMPILTNAKRLVITSVAKRNEGETEAVHDFARQFADNGISTDTQVIPVNNIGISGLLSAAAEDCRADLVVMGAYGHSRFRQLIFGSCTEALIRDVDRPILLMH